MRDAFVAVDASRMTFEHRRVYRLYDLGLLRKHFPGELMAFEAGA